MPIDEPQPSQLYLDGSKLAEVASWFDFDDPEYDPLLVREFDGEWVVVDGHTRGVLALLAGESALRCREDPDDDDDHARLYRECVEWCEEAGITSVAGLVGRVVSHETYDERWVQRCECAVDRLDEG